MHHFDIVGRNFLNFYSSDLRYAPFDRSSFRNFETSIIEGKTPSLMAIFAARPAASPIAMQDAITLIADIASCVAEMLRPATKRFSTLIGINER